MSRLKRRFGWIALVAVLNACLAISASAATIESPAEGAYVLSNGDMARMIEAIPGKPLRTLRIMNQRMGSELMLSGKEFALVTDKGEISGDDFKVTQVQANREDDAAVLHVDLEAADWKAVVRYELRDGCPFDTRQLSLEYVGAEKIVLERVWDGVYESPDALKLLKTASSGSDLAAFLRKDKCGVLLNVDFPYSEIEMDQDAKSVRLGYPLGDPVQKGYIHNAEPLNVGVYSLDGVLVGAGGGVAIDFERAEGTWAANSAISESVLTADNPDRGEIRAFRRMYEILAPNRRGTAQLHYQTYDDMDPRREQASAMDRPETLHRDIGLAKKWGFNSYMLYEDHNVFLPERPPLSVVAEVSERAKREGLAFGSGNPCNYGTGFFWKSEPKPWPREDWTVMDADGKRQASVQCWAAPGFVDYLLERDVPWLQKYGWTNWGFDFFIMNPCHDPAHGHPAGHDSLYKQMKAAVDYHERLRNASKDPGHFLIYTWLGYEPWMPKMGKWADYFYMADPANSWPIPAVNLHEQMGANYRRMYWRLFMEQGVPGYMLQNPIFLANWRDGLIRDAETYQNNFINLFGFSPNVNMQQPWRFLDSLTVKEYEAANEFFPKWLQYAKDNFAALRNLIVLSPSPAPGVLEAYAHPSDAGDKCILVLINTNFFRLEKTLSIGSLLGLKDNGSSWMIRERFPLERWELIDGRTRWNFDEEVRLSVPPKTTMLLEIAPQTPVERGGVRWYGLPDGLGGPTDEGIWQFQDEQSKTYEVAVELPTGSYVAAVQARNPEPKDPFTTIPSKFKQGCTHFQLTFPPNILSEPVQRELSDWVVQPGSLEEGFEKQWTKGIAGKPVHFPLDSILKAPDPDKLISEPASLSYEGANIGKFMGTMLYHPWYWNMPLEVRLEKRPGNCPEDTAPTSPEEQQVKEPSQFPECAAYWLSTNLNLMAVQNRCMGYTPYFDQHMFIPLPFADYKNIEAIQAWVNGIPAQIEKMDYLFTPPFGQYFEHGSHDFMYYLDGSKNNLKNNFWDATPNNITVWVKWKE